MIRALEIVEAVFWGQPEEELNLPLLAFPQGQQLTLRDAFENVLFIGSQGSGKTTSARTYYRALLKEQFGGLVLCVKESQLREFLTLCQECDRAGDVIVFGQKEKHVFNPLEGVSIAEATSLLVEIAEVLGERGRSGVSENETFWRQQCEIALRNLLVLCQLVYGRLEIRGIATLFAGRASTANQLADPAWRQSSLLAGALEQAQKQPDNDGDLGLAIDYFVREFPGLGDRLQGSVAATVSGILEHLRRQPLAGLFGGQSTFTMRDLLYGGKICVLGMPTQGSGESGTSPVEGKVANGVLQFCFCRAATRAQRETNVFLISDECQETVSRELLRQLSVLREYRVATVLLTQNLAVIDARVGREAREALLSNLKTKVLLQQNHAETREWAAQQIGKVKREQPHESTQWGRGTAKHSEHRPIVEEYRVAAAVFAKLKTGGPQNHFIVESVMLKGGAVWRARWHQTKPGSGGTVRVA